MAVLDNLECQVMKCWIIQTLLYVFFFFLHFNEITAEELSFQFCSRNSVNFQELARCSDDFSGAQLKAVCVEAVSNIFYVSSISRNIYIYIIHI